jgi:mono/diheme cytochrome c family protein
MQRRSLTGIRGTSKDGLSHSSTGEPLQTRAAKGIRHLKNIFAGALLVSAMPLIGQPKNAPKQPPQAKTVPAEHADRGQQVFEQNCSRCHNAPTGFSPRISGTVAMHMRVRASLSEEDYKALRRFLNP